MAELRLLIEDIVCINQEDRRLRDQFVYEMAVQYLNDVAGGIIREPGKLMVSFYDREYLDRFREWLQESGWSYAVGEQMGCTCVLQMVVPACPRSVFLHVLEP